MLKVCADEKRFIRERRLFIVFSILSITAPILSLVDELRPSTEEFHTWFQRSGSTMVVLALLAEVRAYQMFDVFKPSGFVSDTYFETKKKYYSQVKLYSLVAFILIAVGTIIWGYGDILVKYA